MRTQRDFPPNQSAPFRKAEKKNPLMAVEISQSEKSLDYCTPLNLFKVCFVKEQKEIIKRRKKNRICHVSLSAEFAESGSLLAD